MSILANNIRRAYFAKKGAEPIDPDLLYWLPLDGREMYFAEGYGITTDNISQPFEVSTYLGKNCLKLDYLSSSSYRTVRAVKNDAEFRLETSFTTVYTACFGGKTSTFFGGWENNLLSSLFLSTEDENNKLSFNFFKSSPTRLTLSFDSWHSIALRRNGETASLFIDGVLANASTSTKGTSKFNVIAKGPKSSSSNYFRNIRLYNRALTDAEILALSQEN